MIQSSTQQDYLQELYTIIPINLHGKPWGWGRIQANNKKCTHFSHQKYPSYLINLHPPRSKVSLLHHHIAIFIQWSYKSFISSCSHCFYIIFLKPDFINTHAMLIFINQFLLIVAFSMIKALNGQSSTRKNFYSPHLWMLFGKASIS